MHSSWEEIFNNYPKIDELNNMIKEIDEQRLTKTIYPPKEQVFRVFDLALEDIKVVILGQDPYHNPDQACGLSFMSSRMKKSMLLRLTHVPAVLFHSFLR